MVAPLGLGAPRKRRRVWGVLLVSVAAGLATAPVRGGAADSSPARPDPMRPTPGAKADRAAPAGPVTGPAAAAEMEGPPRLVSVHRLRGQPPRALLGQQWVSPGDGVGAWRVVAIGDDYVRLSQGQTTTVVRLWPQLPR